MKRTMVQLLEKVEKPEDFKFILDELTMFILNSDVLNTSENTEAILGHLVSAKARLREHIETKNE